MMFVVFFAVVAVASATPYYVSTGASNQYRTQDETGNYRFGYDESHPSGGTFRDETGDSYGNKYGSYGLREADGRFRVVNYVADANGFRAEIKSNEPGLAPSKEPAWQQVKTAQHPVKEPVRQQAKKPVQQQQIEEPAWQQVEEPAITTVKKPVLYAPAGSPVTYSHPYNPEYPLLYHNPYYASYGTYKGTPFRNYGPNYKGTPYIRKSYPSYPYATRHGYYVYP